MRIKVSLHDKSYNEDIISNTTGESNETILYYISNFKSIYPTLESNIQNSFVDYIVQLTELSFLYFKE